MRTGSNAPAARRAAASSFAVVPGSVAPVGTRVLAYLLDAVVVLLAAGLGYAVAVGTGDTRALLLPGLLGFLVVVAQWIAEARTGATVGNAVTGIRTVSATTGRPAGLLAILLRQLVVGLGTLACLVGQWVVVASGAWDRSTAQRGWHDKAAGTLVLRVQALRRTTGGAATVAWSTAVARAVGQPTGPQTSPTAPVPAMAPAPVAGAAPVGVAPATLPPALAPAVLVPDPPAVAGPDGEERGLLRRARRAAPAASEPVITGGPGGDPAASITAPPASALIDVPASAVPDAPVAAPRGPGLLAGPRPDLTGAPLVRPADPVLGGVEHTRLRSTPPVRTGLHLRFDTGEELDVTGDGLVGRSPAPEPGVVHVVPIVDVDRSISKVHLAFGLEPGGRRLWVLDRNSTNGTVLVGPDGASAALPPGTRAVVEPGWTVRFGRRSLAVLDA